MGEPFFAEYLGEAHRVIDGLDVGAAERIADELARLRERGGRLFVLGVGGSAGNASHAVNDFRKLTGIEAYAPTDNVSELTARTNDDGWASVFEGWLKVSRLARGDAILVFSVGGGDDERNVSPNLVRALQYAKETGATVLGIVGRDGGYTARVADACVIVPTVNPQHVTPHSEAFAAVLWHGLVSHPKLKLAATKWESLRSKPAVFLDRDGVLNEAIVRRGVPHPPLSLAELRVVAGAQRAVELLHEAGFLAIGATNQPDVARKAATADAVESINEAVVERVGLDALYTCFHDDADACDCRKPKPGLLLRAAREHGIDLAASYFVGDRGKDVACGRAAGCTTVFVDRGYAETPRDAGADATVRSLDEAVRVILSGALRGAEHTAEGRRQ